MTGTSVDSPLMMSVCRSAALRETTTARMMRSSSRFVERLEGLLSITGLLRWICRISSPASLLSIDITTTQRRSVVLVNAVTGQLAPRTLPDRHFGLAPMIHAFVEIKSCAA